ncbi:MAG: hypothetical protein JWN29_1195 [Acidimicrobiales bacterium]|jgi:hypothetical protein|nr:hypothetical protein [Acidimicrobiales bacterium]
MTITIRIPTAPRRAAEVAPTYSVDRPLSGLKVGLRHEGSWRSWMWIVDEWEGLLRADGAEPVVLEAGGRVGDEGVQTRADVAAWVDAIDCGVSGLGTCGSCTSNSVHDAVTLERAHKPAVVAVCEEFEVHGRNMANSLGHADLKHLVLPYPLEGRPEKEIREIAHEYYPRFLEVLGVPA